MISLVDYGLGNILAFANVYKRLNIPVSVARTPGDLAGAEGIILPGVGAFDHAMERLNQSGLRETLERKVLEERIPVLGVCVGMQMLGRSSEEGRLQGLGWIKGTVKRFQIDEPSYPLPHMGWNDVEPRPECPLFADFKEQARFYFLHSYYMECDDPGDVAATCSYGIGFACAVASGNIHGAQFHPEKSHHCGTQLLKNFAGLRSC